MEKTPIPFKQMFFVCTNKREPGQRISCAGEGRCGEEILMKLKTYIKENKLEKITRASKSGCQEMCEQGPVVTILPQNETYQKVKLEDLEKLIKNHL